jgi:dTDP-4-dehydrorhamnose 3,5-epimerase-like enzyme
MTIIKTVTKSVKKDMRTNHEKIMDSAQSLFKNQVTIYDLITHIDDRGYLTQVYDREVFKIPNDNEMVPIGNIYVTNVLNGVTKAWHCHSNQTDRMVCISGRVLLGLVETKDDTVEDCASLILDAHVNPKIVIISPGIWHGFMGLSDNNLVLNCTDRVYNPAAPDEIRAPYTSFGGATLFGVHNR